MKKYFRIFFGFFFSLGSVPGAEFFELPPISYSETASEDELAKFAERIEAEGWAETADDDRGFLAQILKALQVPEESQVLVFSRTSLQTSLIRYATPRALYFSMDTYVGWVPGGKVEVIIEDEKLGPVFYTIEPPRTGKAPVIRRATDSCLQCHATSRTEGVPGMMVRSVIPDENGHAILKAGTSTVTDETPIKDRWGGWYVTGEIDDPHLGNRWSLEKEVDQFQPQRSALSELGELFETDRYLKPTSDVVALLVFEHQCRIHNLLTKAKYSYARARHFQKGYQEEVELDSVEGVSWRTADSAAREIVNALLMGGEAELGGDGVAGGGEFAKTFQKGGLKSAKGESLRDLRLYERIFKYRCSYMIYSKAFKSMPEAVKTRVFAHLQIELNPKTANHLSSREKKTISAILSETVPGFQQ